MTSKVVAIDGTSYVGKSTIAKCLAALMGYAYINTGHMFRSVAKMCLDRKIALENIEDVLRLAEGMEFAFRKEGDRYLTVVNGDDWTDRLDDYEVVLSASKEATIGQLRGAISAPWSFRMRPGNSLSPRPRKSAQNGCLK
jgi:cytidylate kinase